MGEIKDSAAFRTKTSSPSRSLIDTGVPENDRPELACGVAGMFPQTV